MLVPIKFLQGWSKYNAGEIAGFDPVLAGDIVNSGVAIPMMLADLQREKERQKIEDAVFLDERRKEQIRATGKLYQGLINQLDPKKDKARIKMLTEEQEKMARLIAESKG